jgi:hypothetical protein
VYTSKHNNEEFADFFNLLTGSVYLSKGIFAFVTSGLFVKLGGIKSFVIGGLGHFLFIATNLLMAWRADYFTGTGLQDVTTLKVILLFGSIANGICASFIWVAQGTYLYHCGTDTSQGFYFGLFWSIFNLCNILGPIIAAIVFQMEASLTMFFIIITVISLLASIGFGFMKEPKE